MSRPQYMLWEQLIEVTNSYYRPLPFHNQQHALADTMLSGLEQRAILAERGFIMNVPSLMGGLAIHDVDNWKPLEGNEFQTIEERSAFIGRPLLRRLGFNDERYENGIKPIVIATTPGVLCDTVSQRVAVRSDVVNVAQEAAPWEDLTMLSNTVKLFFEANLLRTERGEARIGWTEFTGKQQNLLGLYKINLSADIADDHPLNEKFLRHFLPNVAFLGDDRVTDPERFYAHYGEGIAEIVPFPIRQEDFTGQAAA